MQAGNHRAWPPVRKPREHRGRIKRAVAVTAAFTFSVACAVLATNAEALAAHAATVTSHGHITNRQLANDIKLCVRFPEFGSYRTSLTALERTVPQWERYAAGADPELARFGRSLAEYLEENPAAKSTGGRWMRVYLACNPDA